MSAQRPTESHETRRAPIRYRFVEVRPSGDPPVPSRATVWFGALSPPSRYRRSLSPRAWTCVGGLAIPLWATWPTLSLYTRDIPAFECLAIAFLVASFVLSRAQPRLVKFSADASSRRSWIPAVAFAVGASGSAVFFLLATHHIPAAEANLITYLWPGMIVGLGAMFGIFRLRKRHIVGITLGFVGAAVLTWGGSFALSYSGIGLALLGGIFWALYCVFRLKWKEATGPLLARGFGISAALCGLMHLVLEPSVVPTIHSAAAATLIGILPAAFANLAWDEGFRRGDSQLLAVMAYATPVCSALLLIALGLESFTGALLVGAVLTVIAGFCSRTES